MDRLARGLRPQRRRKAGGDAKRRPRRHRPHRERTRAGRCPRPGQRGEPRQVAVPGDGQPRDSNPAQRHHRHERAVDGYAADAGAADLRQSGEDVRRCLAVADRGAPRLFQDRGRQDRPRAPPVRAADIDREYHRIAGAAGAGQGYRDRGLCRRAAADGSGRRCGAAAAGAAQSRRQRYQVHRNRRRRADRRARHPVRRDQFPDARHRHRHLARSAASGSFASSSRPTRPSREAMAAPGWD